MVSSISGLICRDKLPAIVLSGDVFCSIKCLHM